ncbi:Protein-glutamate methylesterase/protein-glutamine glutaminase [Azospirillaceae bacterium]
MINILGKTTANISGSQDHYRVMAVDDSAVIRGLLTRALEGDAEIRVVSSVGDGQMAINSLQRNEVDVIVLDIEMPVMDGLTAIPKLLAILPSVKIIMASTLTLKNADVSLRALSLGAADYIPKPTSTREISGAENFRLELVSKVKALGLSARRGIRPRVDVRSKVITPPNVPIPLPPSRRPGMPSLSGSSLSRLRGDASTVALRPFTNPIRPDIIAIGSSTGGPQALFEVLSHLKDGVTQPIIITQHMPATFTTILAEHISRQCGINCAEAKDGDAVVENRTFVAPGDYHMILANRGGGVVVTLTKDPPENFCRPAVDPMMRSMVKIYGRKILAVILTGMGQDGLKGCQDVVQAGGIVIGQDEPSSVVWGMPGAVATAGLCSAVLPLKEIGPYIRKLALRTAA